MQAEVPSQSQDIPESNPNTQMKFMMAWSLAAISTAAGCANPIFLGPAVVLYGEAIRQARKIPELNQPTNTTGVRN